MSANRSVERPATGTETTQARLDCGFLEFERRDDTMVQLNRRTIFPTADALILECSFMLLAVPPTVSTNATCAVAGTVGM